MSFRVVVPYFSGSLVPSKFKLGPLIRRTFFTMINVEVGKTVGVEKMTQQETVWICAERIRCATCSRDFRLEEQKEKAGRKGMQIENP